MLRIGRKHKERNSIILPRFSHQQERRDETVDDFDNKIKAAIHYKRESTFSLRP
jgi:hypothetical protein